MPTTEPLKSAHGVMLTTLIIGCLLCTGCLGPRSTRISQNEAFFASVDPFSQKLIRQGLINLGFTNELVYLALGKPNRTRTIQTSEGEVQVWIYRNFLYRQSGAVSINSRNLGTRSYGPIASSSAPGGPSLSSTRSGPWQPTLSDDGGSTMGTLHVNFVEGFVVAAVITN